MALAEMPLLGRRIHTYHASADLLALELKHPFHEKVRPQAHVELYGGGEKSYYHFKHSDQFRLEGIISYQSGYSQVAGHRSEKPGHGYATLTTTVIEGFNILEVVTADRIVGQISTEYPLDGAVPEVSFLGTRFDNLRIGGKKVEVDTDLDIFGAKPIHDKSYLEEQSVIDRMAGQHANLGKAGYRPDWPKDDYPWGGNGWKKTDENGAEIVQCSLVDGIEGYKKSFGHAIDVPHFGKIYLGEVTLKREKACKQSDYDSYTFHLTMVRFKLGCPTETSGSGGAGSQETNGTGSKG
jgi:hypothetical protein